MIACVLHRFRKHWNRYVMEFLFLCANVKWSKLMQSFVSSEICSLKNHSSVYLLTYFSGHMQLITLWFNLCTKLSFTRLIFTFVSQEHESEGGRTPLMKAARAGHLCTVQFLISKGVLLTHFNQVKCSFLYISLPKCAKSLLSQFSFSMLFRFDFIFCIWKH